MVYVEGENAYFFSRGGAEIEGEQLLGGIVGLVCILVPFALLIVFTLGYYYLARPKGPRSGKFGNNARMAAILQEFERQYKQGKITRAQFEDILIRYFPNGRN